mmetsp:Transcript_13944/g.25851  ORF Transcript_13944/g.25851 Transcript_13944/m.25851 type:complete len:205 (-) Transcript_13944:583-1197(-)
MAYGRAIKATVRGPTQGVTRSTKSMTPMRYAPAIHEWSSSLPYDDLICRYVAATPMRTAAARRSRFPNAQSHPSPPRRNSVVEAYRNEEGVWSKRLLMVAPEKWSSRGSAMRGCTTLNTIPTSSAIAMGHRGRDGRRAMGLTTAAAANRTTAAANRTLDTLVSATSSSFVVATKAPLATATSRSNKCIKQKRLAFFLLNSRREK